MYVSVNMEYTDFLEKLENQSDKFYAELASGRRYLSSKKDTINIPIHSFTKDALNALYEEAKNRTDRSLMMQLSSYLNLCSSKKAKISNIKTFAAAVQDWLNDGAINHWIFRKSSGNYILPSLVTDVKYKEPYQDNPAEVIVSLTSDSPDRWTGSSLCFISEDIRGKTMDEAFLAVGCVHETRELVDEYNQIQLKYLENRQKNYEQFIVTGEAFDVRHSYDDMHVEDVRAIMDDYAGRKFRNKIHVPLWSEDELYPVPIVPFHRMYSLNHYNWMYLHTSSIKLYEYDDSIKDKLILPKTHRMLLDILTSKMDVLKGDIIEGKAAGTTILCKGLPGTGKTLTAEAYSEIIHKPLFRISAGQLGVSSDSVEKNLEEYLRLSQRFGAVMLIDEADTFIRKRENDIQQNAIVASFLRKLEYFNGLLFMTTNRVDDIDDAIESRCIATIKYDVPEEKEKTKIWQVLSKEFSIVEEGKEELTLELINTLNLIFPVLSGRDIKELLKLTSRYSAGIGRTGVTKEDFITCAQFRGVKINVEDK